MSQFAGWATPTQSCNHKNETVQLPTKAIIVRFVSVLIYRCIDVCRTFYLFEFCWCLDLVSARAGFGWERRWWRTSFKTTCCSHNTTMLSGRRSAPTTPCNQKVGMINEHWSCCAKQYTSWRPCCMRLCPIAHAWQMLCWTSCRTGRVFLLRSIGCIVRFFCSCSVALLPFECTRCS
jgi:hypothetical protein